MHPGLSGTRRTIGDVRDPCPVRSLDVELPVERIIDNDGGAAAIFARTTFVTDLSLDPGKPCQTCDAVRAAHLSLIEQIVMKLAIAIDLAALGPGLPDQFGLADIVPRTQA